MLTSRSPEKHPGAGGQAVAFGAMHPYRGWPFLSEPQHPVLSAGWAILIHGLIALVCVAPLLWRSCHWVYAATLAFIGGSALDLDHVVAAGSLDPRRLEHLSGGRPPTHSLLFALALTLLALAVTRRGLIAWAVFAVVVSHLLFDAAGGGERWLYPLREPEAIPWLVCPLGILGLAIISWVLARGMPARPVNRVPGGPLPSDCAAADATNQSGGGMVSAPSEP